MVWARQGVGWAWMGWAALAAGCLPPPPPAPPHTQDLLPALSHLSPLIARRLDRRRRRPAGCGAHGVGRPRRAARPLVPRHQPHHLQAGAAIPPVPSCGTSGTSGRRSLCTGACCAGCCGGGVGQQVTACAVSSAGRAPCSGSPSALLSCNALLLPTHPSTSSMQARHLQALISDRRR